MQGVNCITPNPPINYGGDMPYLYYENTKQKMKVDIKVCFANLCPFIDKNLLTCNFKPEEPKRTEKRKKK